MQRLRTALHLLGLATIVACTPARREFPDDTLLRNVHFEGNGGLISGHSDYQLRAQMEQEDSPFGTFSWPLTYAIDPSVFNIETLARDAYRLEVFYAHNGWFDAEFKGWMVREVRKKGAKSSNVVDVLGVVDPGEQSMISSIKFKGIDDNLGLKLIAKKSLRNSSIYEGAPFSLAYTEATRQQIEASIHDASHAYGRVRQAVVANPTTKKVRIRYHIDPGITAEFGKITIKGAPHVPRKMIRQNLPFRKGDPYKASMLSDAQAELFDLGAFSVVQVKPDLSDPTQEFVPVRVRLNEAKFRTIRAGGGAKLAGTLFQPRAFIRFQHVNLFERLVLFESEAAGGFATDLTSSAAFTLDGIIPTFDLSSALSFPRIGGPRYGLKLQGRFVQDLQAAQFPYRSPEADVLWQWRIIRPRDRNKDGTRQNRSLTLITGPHIEYFKFLENLGLDPSENKLLPPEYVLTSYDLNLAFDSRSPAAPASPNRGGYAAGGIRQAVPLTENGFRFSKFTGDFRKYWGLASSKAGDHGGVPIVLAGRVHGQVILPYEDLTAIELPYAELGFLGGPENLRGFRLDQVGDYDVICTYPAGPRTLENLVPLYRPRGGVGVAGTSFEPRYDWAYGLSFATFIDAGIVARTLRQLAEERAGLIRYGSGVGFRYASPVGPIRFDVGLRPLFEEDVKGSVTPNGVNCDADDDGGPRPKHANQYRAADFFSGTEENRAQHLRPPGRPPLVMNFYLSIGQAF